MTRRARHARPSSGVVGWARTNLGWRALAAAVLIVVLGSLIIYTRATTSSESPVPAQEPSQPIVELGTVVRVVTPVAVDVRVGDGAAVRRVDILGIVAPPPCGYREAMDFATKTLLNKPVTLVPDPTLAFPATAPGEPRPSYVVLPTQLSYTDAAIRAGHARVGIWGQPWYLPVFQREQREAQDDEEGVWGPPCNLPETG